MQRRTHDHEWLIEQTNDAFLYEDGAVHIFEECEYADERPAGHSERLDETFYETVFECEARRSHRFDLTGIRALDGDGDPIATLAEGSFEAVQEAYEQHTELVEQIEQRAAERLCADGDDEPLALDWVQYGAVDTDEHTVTIDLGGDHYELTFTHDGTEVL